MCGGFIFYYFLGVGVGDLVVWWVVVGIVGVVGLVVVGYGGGVELVIGNYWEDGGMVEWVELVVGVGMLVGDCWVV